MPQPHPPLLIMTQAHTHALWGEGYTGQWVPPENDILSSMPPSGHLAWASMGNGKETVCMCVSVHRDYLHVWKGEQGVC